MVRNVEDPGKPIAIAAPAQVTQRTTQPLERQIDDAIAEKPLGIDLNVDAVEILDSFGLNWLIEIQTRLTSCDIKLQLTDVNQLVADVMHATRLEGRFHLIKKQPEGERNA